MACDRGIYRFNRRWSTGVELYVKKHSRSYRFKVQGPHVTLAPPKVPNYWILKGSSILNGRFLRVPLCSRLGARRTINLRLYIYIYIYHVP